MDTYSDSSSCNGVKWRKQENSYLAPCRVSRNGNVCCVIAVVLGEMLKNLLDLKTISQFALLEYKHGEPERGKTLFEGIIDSHPKRWDMWSIYMDMEANQKNIQGLRYVWLPVSSFQEPNSHQ
jgi:hypothetical protein